MSTAPTSNDQSVRHPELLHPAVAAAAQGASASWRAMACDEALADTIEFCEHYGIALEDSANAIVVWGKSEPPVYAMCMVLATDKLDVNGTVRRTLGTRKASFAPFDVGLELTGMSSGGITPVGRPPDMPLYIDAAVMERNEIAIGGGNRTSKLVCSPELLTELGGQVIDGLAKHPAPEES